jgi:hypothetical protein
VHAPCGGEKAVSWGVVTIKMDANAIKVMAFPTALCLAGLFLLGACKDVEANVSASVEQTNADDIPSLVVPEAESDAVQPELPDLRNAYQARVMAAGSSSRLALCDNANAKGCAAGRYLVPGDIVLVREEAGQFLRVNFVNARGGASEGWVRRDRTERLSEDFGANSSWESGWESDALLDPYVIDIKKGTKRHEYEVKGEAIYGQNDPWRLEHGSISFGEFSGRILVHGDTAELVEGGPNDEPFNCRVTFRKFGLFLIVADNRKCGGHNVSFDRVYRAIVRKGEIPN